MTATTRFAGTDDAALLHRLAAATFALACPPGTTAEAIADFVATNLSEARFADYLADGTRMLLIAEAEGTPVGYTMLVAAEPTDADVASVVTARPTVELSKFYMLADAHGSGAAAVLMRESVAAARARGASSVWLGVNIHNGRANRFYEKNGFERVGTKRFLVGGNWEDDYVRELSLVEPARPAQ
jgi:ribosomal protein S18 acetylase RimI-like enzyme